MTDFLSLIYYSLTHVDLNGFIIPLLVYATLIAIYGIFVWAFYKTVSKRDLFRLNISDHNHVIRVKFLYFLKYIVVFPALTFLWFGALAIILFFLSKNQSTENILLISMALVAGTRITSYYKEELSQELAKIMPLAVIGIFVVDPTFFSYDAAFSHFYKVPSLVPLLLQYLIFIMVMEFVFRLLLLIKRHIKNPDQEKTRKKRPKKKETIKKEPVKKEPVKVEGPAE